MLTAAKERDVVTKIQLLELYIRENKNKLSLDDVLKAINRVQKIRGKPQIQKKFAVSNKTEAINTLTTILYNLFDDNSPDELP